MTQETIETQESSVDTSDDLGELPAGWCRATLPHLIGQGGLFCDGDWVETKDQDPTGDVRLIQLADVGEGIFKNKSNRFLTSAKARELECTFLGTGDVLIARLPEPLGRACIFPGDPKKCVTAVDVCIVRPGNSGFDPRWIMHTLNSPQIRIRVQGFEKGTTRPRVSRRNLAFIGLPIPPLAEQNRIIEKIDQLLARVNAARGRVARVSAILKRFRQAILAAACSGRLTAEWREQNPNIEPTNLALERLKRQNGSLKTRRGIPETVTLPEELAEYDLPETWSIESIGALLRVGGLADVKDGNHGSNHPKAKELGTDGLPFITAAQVKNYRIDYKGAPKVCGEPLKRLKVGFAQIGDAVLTHKGSVGRAAVNTQPCVLTPQTTYYRCNEGLLNSDYLVYFFTSHVFFSQCAGVMSQTTRDFVPISEQYRLFVFLPPLDEQKEIVQRVEALFKLAGAIEKRVAAATARAEKLTQAILAKAFRGELVTTEAELARREGRSYEPASALLARVRTLRPHA